MRAFRRNLFHLHASRMRTHAAATRGRIHSGDGRRILNACDTAPHLEKQAVSRTVRRN